jgi:ppGpp synthetase/RelA/SpoT-type nucleotidyltranferase
MVSTIGEPVLVAQRLKRRPRIVEKLVRHPTMGVSRMQDVAGCRAELTNLDAVDLGRRRIEQAGWSIADEDDYNADPKTTGYRAVHLVVIRDATPVEIQLRTTWQQGWAAAVERLDLRYGLTLKDGHGPEPLARFMERVAYARDLQGRGIALGPGLRDELAKLAAEAEKWLSNRRSTR